MYLDQSCYRPTRSEEIVAKNRYFTVKHVPVNVHDPVTGEIKKYATRLPGGEGGEQNWIEVTPGSLIVAVDGDSESGSVLLKPEERWTTDIIENAAVMHWELPGGAFEDGDQGLIFASAARELEEEAGVIADEFTLVGPPRGHMPHPLLTDRNVLVLARGIRSTEGGPQPDTDEAIGAAAWYTWDQTEEMYMKPEGLWTPQGPKIISSDPTISGILKARQWLRRQEA